MGNRVGYRVVLRGFRNTASRPFRAAGSVISVLQWTSAPPNVRYQVIRSEQAETQRLLGIAEAVHCMTGIPAGFGQVAMPVDICEPLRCRQL
jgi:hypothetical protein